MLGKQHCGKCGLFRDLVVLCFFAVLANNKTTNKPKSDISTVFLRLTLYLLDYKSFANSDF